MSQETAQDVKENKTFVLSETFKNISLENPEDACGIIENHHNIPWRLSVTFSDDGNYIELECMYRFAPFDWSIETEIELKFGVATCRNGKAMYRKISGIEHTFTFAKDIIQLPEGFLMGDLEKVDGYGEIKLECHVTILKITGLKTEKLRKFDESAMEFSDVVLVVGDQKFYISKLLLAAHSTYFKALFLGNFQESGVSEIELKNVDPTDFQNYLELIYGDSLVEDGTVVGILQLADFFDSKSAMKRCEDFLMDDSQQPIGLKFQMAIRYKLDQLKKVCFSIMTSAFDFLSAVPEDSSQFDHTVWKELFLKSHLEEK